MQVGQWIERAVLAVLGGDDRADVLGSTGAADV